MNVLEDVGGQTEMKKKIVIAKNEQKMAQVSHILEGCHA